MRFRQQMSAIFFLSVTLFSGCVLGCGVDDVAVYKVTLHMMWNEDMFQKEYPSNQKAQWAQVVGQSHNRSYTLYRTGEVATPSVRNYAQFGILDHLMEEGGENPKVYDQFSAPAVVSGIGITENMVFLNGEHSLISLICRMTPSPDWFVGVDSLDLCVGSWVDQVTLDLEPLDAGAVNTWNRENPRETDPLEPVGRVSQRNSDNLSPRFHFRKFRQLPPIAKVEFTKIHEYSTKELNDLTRKQLISKMKPTEKLRQFPGRNYYNTRMNQNDMYRTEDITKSAIDQLTDLEEEAVGTPMPNIPENNVVVVRKVPTQIAQSEEESDSGLTNMDDVVLAVATGKKLGLGRHLPRHFKSRLHHAVNRNRRMRRN